MCGNSIGRWFTVYYDRESGEITLQDQIGTDLLGAKENVAFFRQSRDNMKKGSR
nr:hypothetical protein [uncultured Agathobaculum sp.]